MKKSMIWMVVMSISVIALSACATAPVADEAPALESAAPQPLIPAQPADQNSAPAATPALGAPQPASNAAASAPAEAPTQAAQATAPQTNTNGAWLPAYLDGCPSEALIAGAAHPLNSAYPAPDFSADCAGGVMTIMSNGIPTFEFVQTTPNALQAQNYTWEIPLTPSIASTPGDVPLGGAVAVSVDGLPIFGPTEAPNDGYRDPVLDELLDYCNGHTAQRGDYHYHARQDCLFSNMEGNTRLILGWSLDGYPILAPYLCVDAACTQVVEATSSWQMTNPTVDNAWEMHSYVAGSGNLDQCNGAILPDGSYAYFATDTFPYFVGCYRGEVSASAQGQQGGMGQTGVQGGQQPAGQPTGQGVQPGSQPGGQPVGTPPAPPSGGPGGGQPGGPDGPGGPGGGQPGAPMSLPSEVPSAAQPHDDRSHFA